jgi:hypothetical protein
MLCLDSSLLMQLDCQLHQQLLSRHNIKSVGIPLKKKILSGVVEAASVKHFQGDNTLSK